MTDAAGIHAHPTLKLGRRPENRDKPKIALAGLLTAVPSHPVAEVGPHLVFDMDRNNVAGDCVVAGTNHALQVINALLGVPYTPWTDAQLLTYYQSQNPDFRSWADAGSDADAGMDIADFLSYLVKKNVILGFAKVDHTSPDEVQAATYLGLCLVSGVNLQVAQQQGNTWNYMPGSASWGGHCIAQDGYLPYQTITWGADDYFMTPAFMARQVDEVYFVITQGLADDPGFRDHLSLAAFGAAFTAITGRPWTYTPTPAPIPTPVPTPVPVPPTPVPPTPGGGASFRLGDATAARVDTAAVRSHLSPDMWLEHHLRSYFRMGLDNMAQTRRFELHRAQDVSGVSGTGVVADGVVFPDGTVALRWRGDYPSSVTHDRGVDAVVHVHGHDGASTIYWLDPDPADGLGVG